ncbi:MAG: hypothetical protein HYW50_03295 [Candidatus Diapherotrites archaeon]|nr:hypothetical protein [Candidatus Diapherotrites archaeon]
MRDFANKKEIVLKCSRQKFFVKRVFLLVLAAFALIVLAAVFVFFLPFNLEPANAGKLAAEGISVSLKG